MRRLIRTLAGRRANGERGAVLVLTAVLVMFVAIGMLALTVDLGNITYNRAQLQNGADAASLALASACANSASPGNTCGVTPRLTSLAVANGNISNGGDQSMSILTDTRTCIGGAPYTGTTTLPTCAPPAAAATDLSRCQPLPSNVDPSKVSYVEVTTQTKVGANNVLPFHFAQLISGEGPGTTNNTCSRAAWFASGSTGLTFPLSIGMCDWKKDSASGGNYAPAPPYSPGPSTSNPQPAVPSAVAPYVYSIFAQADTTNKCSTDPNGGFSWLQSSATCLVTVNVGDWVSSDPGSSVPTNCKNILQNYLGQIVFVPVFDAIRGTGSGAQYHIAGVASFYLAGWDNIPALSPKKTMSVYKEPSGICTGKCNGSTTYVWGWFTTGLLPVPPSNPNPGPQFGTDVVVPAG